MKTEPKRKSESQYPRTSTQPGQDGQALDPAREARTPDFLERGLPAVEIRDLPSPKPLWLLLGPGVVMLATSLGSGEIYWWPGITAQYGFVLLWPALIALFLQYVLNTEFARYTLATGETAVSGFIRIWRPLAWVFLAGSTLPWLWPGWSKGGAIALSWVVGGSPTLFAIVSLGVIGIALTGTRVVYRAVERIQVVLTVFIIAAVGILALLTVRAPTLRAFGDGLVSLPTIPEDLEIAKLLTALAFCGAGGSINLATSNWMRDKGFGMGARVPKIQRWSTGERISSGSSGFFFAPTSGNLARWNAWWKLARREQTLTFLVPGAIGLVLLMLIAHALLYGRGVGIGMGMLQAQGEVLAARHVSSAGTIFYLVVAAVFLTSALGVLDHMARVSSDILKTSFAAIRESKHRYLTESALYFMVLWTVIFFACAVLLFGTQDPTELLKIAGCLSGLVMFLYSGLVLVLMTRLSRSVARADGRFRNANPFRLPLWRKIAVAAATIFYGGFSAWLVLDLFQRLS